MSLNIESPASGQNENNVPQFSDAEIRRFREELRGVESGLDNGVDESDEKIEINLDENVFKAGEGNGDNENDRLMGEQFMKKTRYAGRRRDKMWGIKGIGNKIFKKPKRHSGRHYNPPPPRYDGQYPNRKSELLDRGVHSRHNLLRSAEVENPELKVLNSMPIHKVMANLEEFRSLSHQQIAEALVERGDGLLVLMQLHNFEDIDHSKLADSFIKNDKVMALKFAISRFPNKSLDNSIAKDLISLGHSGLVKQVPYLFKGNRREIIALLKE
ncbi:MAG: hypothetical protein OXU73_02090 [Candidatus Campbellbacteria bacterium]|nr:hypothetical protein [Candidatus Campbellbacteria bacterium]